MTESPAWHIVGDWFDNCSCAVACPCTFAQPPDNGFCDSVLFWHIRRGAATTATSILTVSAFSGWADGKAISGRERSRGRPVSSSMNAPTSARRRRCHSFSGAAPEDSPPRSLRCSPKAGRFVEWSAHGSRSRSHPTAPTGERRSREGEGLGKSVDGTDKPAGKVSAAHERARLRDGTRPTASDLGQVYDLLR